VINLRQDCEALILKKILCCDGGGIRGLASVEILAKIEADLRTQLCKIQRFTYLGYDPDLSQSGINELGLATMKAEQVLMLDVVENIGDLQKIGKKFSAAYVGTAAHFEGFY